MMRGEFTAISTIHAILPGLVPKPLGWGKYKAQYPETYFFIEDFIEMDAGGAPEPQQFTARVAELHKKGTSPNGMFGFPVTTCDGKVPHQTGWEKSWAVFFSKLLRGVMDVDAETNGVWPELEVAAKHLTDKVIPRLLGVLQSDGRNIKPSLIHGDCKQKVPSCSHGNTPFTLIFRQAQEN
jgi:protein-ribulosamine 3-kinase